MRPVQMKKWLRVTIPLLLVCLASLFIFTGVFSRSAKLKITSAPRQHRLRYARLANLLRDGPKTYGHVHLENMFTFKPVRTNTITSNNITLAVVEEHHEVIPYWFEAAKKGIIPKSGNTLIHIDGHSDAAMPRYDPKMPFFRWPNTAEELHHMIQENDVFIQAAAMSGLISRFIFINPSWDTSETVTHVATKVDVGTIQLPGVKDPVFCACMVVPSIQQRQCMYEKSAGIGGYNGIDNGGDNGGGNGGDNGGDNGGGNGGDNGGGNGGDNGGGNGGGNGGDNGGGNGGDNGGGNGGDKGGDNGGGNGGDNGGGNGGDKGGDNDGDKDGNKENSDVIIIENPDDCKIRLHYYAEQAVDHVALDMLKLNRNWIGGTGNIILDIDEDYFGVELPGQTLIDAGLDNDLIMQLQIPLSELFCPKRIDHESLGNRMMREVIDSIIRRCQSSSKSDHDTCRVLIGEIRPLVREITLAYRKRDRQLFCQEGTRHMLAVADHLANVLYHFTLKHLRVLMEFGFCLETTPAAIRFREAGQGSFGVCLGNNLPNSSVVFLHKPDAAEISTRTAQLQKILEVIDARHRPNVVTLCRSVRDGYTPRRLFSSIEANILDIFKDLPGHYDVVYDENLYGGKGGWPDRHKRK